MQADRNGSRKAPLSSASVEVGQRYLGWDKTWEVVRVWRTEGVAEIVNVADARNKMRLPLTQFKEMAHA